MLQIEDMLVYANEKWGWNISYLDLHDWLQREPWLVHWIRVRRKGEVAAEKIQWS
jgi:hypothetical protein